jgi:putative molybdopterin biosynthesis protein
MKQIETIHLAPQIKAVADSRRLSILTSLMSRPMTISQLGRDFNKPPSWVRHHVKVLQTAGFVEVSRIQVSDGYLEKYYQATSSAYVIQQLIIPKLNGMEAIIGSGSHDPALDHIFDEVQETGSPTSVFYLRIGSLEGLIALRQGISQFAGCHLFDPITQDYNLPFIRHILPDRRVKLVTLAQRTQGLIFLRENPKGITGPADIARNDIRIVNRNRGSGTRIRLDQQLALMGIMASDVKGYAVEVSSHDEITSAISTRLADVGLGLQVSAETAGLGFIPLFSERFDLVFPYEGFESPAVQRLLDILLSTKTKRLFEGLPGYDIQRLGVILET